MVREDADIPYNTRDCSDDYKANGGLGSIAEQIATSKLDVILGGGAGFFEFPSEDEPEVSVAEIAQRNGYEIIRNRSEWTGIEARSRVLGLFSDWTPRVRMRGVDGAEARRIDRENGEPKLPEPFACEENPGSRDFPSLAEMTQAAIDHLDKQDRFILVIESASIDKQAHLRRPCGHIGEVGQLDEAVAVALNYAASRPEVLIIVTADHGSAVHIIPETSRWAPLNKASPGYFARILTPEGSIMGINYASNDARHEEHTGVQVPVYASGFGADQLPTFMNQVEIFHITARHLGLEQ
jgi:alkaline phosphatase